MIKITAVKVKAEELMPGDLFSIMGPDYWERAPNPDSVGERVYIRTNSACPADQASVTLYRITIERVMQ